jgi:hypothetical protein
MSRAPRQIARLALRDHGEPARVDRIWRRLSSQLPESGGRAARSTWMPATLVAAFGAVAVFGAGVFVGARWMQPELAPTLSAEPPSMPEAAAGPAAPAAHPTQSVSKLSPKPPVAHKGRGSAAASRVVELAPPEVGSAAVEVQPPSAEGVPEWERLAEAGDFDAARAALDAAGGFEAVLSGASAAELMTLVDIGRASGSREQAVAALRRVLDAFPGAPEAPLAAWTLGNLLDQSGDDTGAAEAFALYRRLSPGGDFAEDALAHEVARALGRGDVELSVRLVTQYENEFPNGPRLPEFREELAKRIARAAGTEAPAANSDEPAEPGDLAEPLGDVPSAPAPPPK